MSDSEKVTSALILLFDNCCAALSHLSTLDHHHLPPVEFTTLRTDFLSLLSILHAATTKTALSLKPASPQYKASLAPLKDLSDKVSALLHATRLISQHAGSTLSEEYLAVARRVIDSIKSLAQTFLALQHNSAEDYILRAGQVHDLIDDAKKIGALSLNNYDAVRKLCLREHDSLLDGLREIQELSQPDQGCLEVDLDDGWDELGLGSQPKLTPTELDRVQKVHSLVKLVVLLHKRVINHVLSPEVHGQDDPILDRLAKVSNQLLVASDDLISSMYPQHQLSNITLYVSYFLGLVKAMLSIVIPEAKSVEEELDKLSLSNPVAGNTMKWFTICSGQIDKSIKQVQETLVNDNDSS